MVSLARLIGVLVTSAVVLLLAVTVVYRRVAEWAARRQGSTVRALAAAAALLRKPRIQAWVLALGAMVLLGLADAVLEPGWPEVVRVELVVPKLGPGRPIRVVQLSDFHSEGTVGLEERLPGMVALLKPDLIVFTGDAINRRAGLPHFRRAMTALAQVAPAFAVRGNWDVWWFPNASLFQGTGVRELASEAVPVLIGGRRIWVAGVPVDSEDTISSTLGLLPKSEFILFLHHFPAVARLATPSGADLVLSGDTHGGQARLPLLGELVRIHRFGVWKPLGLGREGPGWLYVNRGIGGEGWIPKLRLFCRPEITLFELRGG
jgi:predicted MPP superfamily phosphohydrolase